jgi:predicted dehydrogenase
MSPRGSVESARFAFFGAGWFARLQLAAWHELGGVRCVALYNRTRKTGEELAARHGIGRVYDDAEELLSKEKVDFIDIVTNPFTLRDFVLMAARRRVPVICQKPLAPSVETGQEMVEACRTAGIPFFVHENWRWQAPLRRLKTLLDEGVIGEVFRARFTMVSGHDMYRNEPTLRQIEKFILTDMGTHVLDIARFYFGEPDQLTCQTHRVHADIRGEDVATVMLLMREGRTTVTCELGYAENPLEHECFPQTLAMLEGSRGSMEIAPDYWIRVTTKSGTRVDRFAPARYAWSDPMHEVVEASIVECNRHLLAAMRGETAAETTGEDNLKTLRLVHDCYDAAARRCVIHYT